MKILALDSAGKTAGVAILDNGKLLYESYLATGNTHSETLMVLVQNAFSVLKLNCADIDLFAVNIGPGSFTGLRIGIALIKGLALPTNALCAGVSTLESLAAACTHNGTIISALNARRGEVYHCAYKQENGEITPLYAENACNAALLEDFVKSISGDIWLMGDGAEIVKHAFNTCENLKLYSQNYILGRAHAVALCAQKMHQKGLCTTVHALDAEYLRLSQAQREREEREKINA